MQAQAPKSAGIAHLIATGFYTGYAPVAPGTVGTLVGVAFAPLLTWVAGASAAVYLALLALAIACAIAASQEAITVFGCTDPSQVVCDEIVGYLVAVAFLPSGWGTLLYAFLFFRLFDITKPPPCRRAERLPGGFGIVVDDLVAGLYANLAVRAALAAGAPVF